MTVKYLQTMQRNQISMAVQSDPNVLHKFKAGFADCTDEVNRYINQIDGVEAGVKQRLIGHLNTCVGGLQQVSPQYNSYTNNYRNTVPFTNSPLPTSAVHQQSSVLPLPHDVNNNGRIQMGGVQLIPSRLPTGELALVMPNSSNLPYFPAATFPTAAQHTIDLTGGNRPRVSAFNSVSKSHVKQMSTDTSPPLSPASSSMSSNDDSTSLPPPDYQPMTTTTPPLQTQQNMLNAFPTPPSAGSITINLAPSQHSMAAAAAAAVAAATGTPTSNSITLQQQQVTSTTEPPHTVSPTGLRIKPLSVITNTNGRNDVQYVNKKRPYPIDLTSDDELTKVYACEPAEKLFKSSESVAQNQNERDNEQANGDMWRPW